MSGQPKPSAVERVIGNLLRRHGRDLEAEYREDRAQQAERLHNALVVTIGAVQPSVETLLYVLEMLKWETLNRKGRELMGSPGETAALPVKSQNTVSPVKPA